MLGSIDANRGDYQNGWDTDQFPIDNFEPVSYTHLGNPVVLEIPEHPFGQTGHRGTDGTAQLHGDIVARQHYLMNLFVNGRLIRCV